MQPHLHDSVPVCFLVHFLVAGSKKLSPHSLSIIFSSATPNCTSADGYGDGQMGFKTVALASTIKRQRQWVSMVINSEVESMLGM